MTLWDVIASIQPSFMDHLLPVALKLAWLCAAQGVFARLWADQAA